MAFDHLIPGAHDIVTVAQHLTPIGDALLRNVGDVLQNGGTEGGPDAYQIVMNCAGVFACCILPVISVLSIPLVLNNLSNQAKANRDATAKSTDPLADYNQALTEHNERKAKEFGSSSK